MESRRDSNTIIKTLAIIIQFLTGLENVIINEDLNNSVRDFY